MSKISADFDTKEKTLAVKIDGKAVANVVGVNLAKSYYAEDEDAYQCSVVTMQKDDENDVRTFTQVMAADSEGAAGKTSEYPGFVKRVVETVQAHIHRFFTRE